MSDTWETSEYLSREMSWSEALESITGVCRWCGGSSASPDRNSKGKPCPCQCHGSNDG